MPYFRAPQANIGHNADHANGAASDFFGNAAMPGLTIATQIVRLVTANQDSP